LHGALLDTELLAEVYLAMTGGQAELLLDSRSTGSPAKAARDRAARAGGVTLRGELRVTRATALEAAAHAARLAAIQEASGGNCLWLALEDPGAQ
jgi:DNA polymerase-3 subunit epsilon